MIFDSSLGKEVELYLYDSSGRCCLYQNINDASKKPAVDTQLVSASLMSINEILKGIGYDYDNLTVSASSNNPEVENKEVRIINRDYISSAVIINESEKLDNLDYEPVDAILNLMMGLRAINPLSKELNDSTINIGTGLEIYLFNNEGGCICSEYSRVSDDNLMTGALTSLYWTLRNIGFSGEDLSIKLESKESIKLARVLLEGDMNIALIINEPLSYDSGIAYEELDDLTNSTVERINEFYHEQIELFKKTGASRFENLDEFINQEVFMMKQHIQTSYLISIISYCLNKNMNSNQLINYFSRMNEIYEQGYEEIIKFHKELSSILKMQAMINDDVNELVSKTNDEMINVYKLFKVPLIDTKPKSTGLFKALK